MLPDDGSWLCYFLLLLSVASYGATITSLGLAIATWVDRLGRAVTWCVTAYIGLVIGCKGDVAPNAGLFNLPFTDTIDCAALLEQARQSRRAAAPSQGPDSETLLSLLGDAGL